LTRKIFAARLREVCHFILAFTENPFAQLIWALDKIENIAACRKPKIGGGYLNDLASG
jgi:hypothetical protein